MNALRLICVLTLVLSYESLAQTCPTAANLRTSSFTIDGKCTITSTTVNQGDLSAGVSLLTIPEGDTLIINGNFNIYDDVDILGVLIVNGNVTTASGLISPSNVYVGENGHFIVSGNYTNGDGVFPIALTGRGNTTIDGDIEVGGTYTNNSGSTTTVSDTGTLQSGTFNDNGGTINIAGGSASDCETGCCGSTCSTLPVILVDYCVKENNGNARLSWSTATEWDNDYFEVLKMNSDESAFKVIGRVAGQGSTNELTSYEFTDHSFNQDCYYQVKQVDYDGQFELFKPLVLIKTNQVSDIEIYPNPTYGNIYLVGSGFSTVKIHDISGRIISQSNLAIGETAETFINRSLEGKTGQFFIVLINEDQQVTKRIEKK